MESDAGDDDTLGRDVPSALPEPPAEPSAAQGSPAPALPDVEREDFIAFVGLNDPEKYVRVFDAQRAGRRGLSPCWPAVFFPQAWLLYRKLYIWAAIAFVSPILIVVFHASGAVGASAGTLVWLTAGFVGRPVYVAHARRVIRQLRASGRRDDEIRALIERAGGVSKPGAWVGGIYTLASAVGGVMIGLVSVQVHH